MTGNGFSFVRPNCELKIPMK